MKSIKEKFPLRRRGEDTATVAGQCISTAPATPSVLWQPWERWEYFALAIPVILFAALAAYRIHAPGLYYDEMFVISPATGTPTYRTWFGIPISISPYVGADKSWIYFLTFLLFGASAWTIRLPAILISCGTLLLGYSLMRRILTPQWALAFTVACAVHPGFIFLTKVDWGPEVFMLFLKALCLLLWFRWLDGAQKSCWSVLGLWVVGFWDKYNFVWFIVALLPVTCVIYRNVIRHKLATMRKGLLAAGVVGLLAVGLLALWIIFPLLQKPQASGLSQRFLQIWAIYEWTVTGLGTASMWFKAVPQLPAWTGWFILASAVICLVVALVAGTARMRDEIRLDRRPLHFSVWSLLMFGIMFLEIAVTRQAGGVHHTIMLFPFDLFACFAAACLLVRALPAKMRAPMILLQIVLLLIWIGAEAQSLRKHFDRFADAGNFWGRWSPRIESLAKYLDSKGGEADAIYCVEWGVGTQLMALCRPETARKIRDDWPTFQHWSPQDPDAKTIAMSVFRPAEKALYVTYSETDPVYRPAQEHFSAMALLAGKTTKLITGPSGKVGQTYRVFATGGR